MLSDSLHCKGLLVHMYFLDEKCVLIFKTDNNKMLYLKILWWFFGFFFLLMLNTHVNKSHLLLHCSANRQLFQGAQTAALPTVAPIQKQDKPIDLIPQ